MFVRRRHDRRGAVLSFCQTLYICSTWVRVTTALPQEASNSNAPIALSTATFDLLPITGLIPSASVVLPSGLIPSQSHGFGLIPSQLPPSDPTPSAPADSNPTSPGLIPSATIKPIDPGPAPSIIPPSQPIASTTAPFSLIPSAPPAPGPFPSASNTNLIPPVTLDPAAPTYISPVASNTASHGPVPPMASTDEGLRPIPAPTTNPGDPNGHHEISEPNFTATVPCRGCSPVIEISRTGFFDWGSTAIADSEGTSAALLPSKATITAGPSEVVISKEPTGGNWVIGGSTTVSAGQTTVVGRTTVTAGQTVIIDNTPIVIQTSNGGTEVVIGSSTVQITVPPARQITAPPFLAPIVIGSQTYTANSNTQYLIGDQTLAPDSPAITVDGTTYSLLPSGTAIVINGVTSTFTQTDRDVFTTTRAPALTLFPDNQVFTANPAGYYVLAPGTTLIPGGPAVTVSGTVVSLAPGGTGVVVQGTTRSLEPVTTVVTRTRPGGGYGGPASAVPSRTRATGLLPPVSAGIAGVTLGGGWSEGVYLLMVLGSGWLALWL